MVAQTELVLRKIITRSKKAKTAFYEATLTYEKARQKLGRAQGRYLDACKEEEQFRHIIKEMEDEGKGVDKDSGGS